MRNRLTNAWSSHRFSSVDNLVDTTQVCEEKQQAAGRKGSKMDGPNAHSKEKEKKKKGCLTKISNFITGSMEKGFYRSVKFFFLFACKTYIPFCCIFVRLASCFTFKIIAANESLSVVRICKLNGETKLFTSSTSEC